MGDVGKLLIVVGGLILLLGIALTVGGRVPFLGRLPGDISYTRGNFHFYFPIATGLLLSLLLTLLINLFFRGR